MNGDKSKFLTFQCNPQKQPFVSLQVGENCSTEETNNAKLLGVTIDNQLKFDVHIKNFCKEAGKKVNALARVASYMNKTKRILLLKTFILSLFNYCPLVWIFCSKNSNNRIIIEERHTL